MSSFHDYHERDPLDQISDDERSAILKHMRYYHGGPPGTKPGFGDLLPYLPMVFHKVAEKLECYLKQLEADRRLEDE